MTAKKSLRNAVPDDFLDIQRLSIQLGYHPTKEHVAKMLEKMSHHSDYEVIVALKDEKVVGWMSLYHRIRIEADSFLQVAALVTDEEVRGEGFGRLLLSYAEEKSKKFGFKCVGLHSSKRRTETHEFYKHVGYSILKESYFFEKEWKL